MFDIKDDVNKVIDNVEDIAKSYYKLAGVTITQKSSKLGSSLIAFSIIIILVFFIFLFIGFGLSYWIGLLLGNPMYGFFVVAGILLVFLIIFLAVMGKHIQPYITNLIIRKIYD